MTWQQPHLSWCTLGISLAYISHQIFSLLVEATRGREEREREREREGNVEIIEKATRKLMDEKALRELMDEEELNGKTSLSHESYVAVDEDDEDNETAAAARGRHHHRRHGLSQLESTKEDNNNSEESSSSSKQEAVTEDALSSEIGENNKVPNEEEIIKELKKLRRQNVITHCLLTAMIVLTLTWQVSEVSLILKIKDGLSNPLKSVGGVIKGFLKRGPEVNAQDVMKDASQRQNQVIEPTYLPGLKIPELPHLDLPGFDSSDDE